MPAALQDLNSTGELINNGFKKLSRRIEKNRPKNVRNKDQNNKHFCLHKGIIIIIIIITKERTWNDTFRLQDVR